MPFQFSRDLACVYILLHLSRAVMILKFKLISRMLCVCPRPVLNIKIPI